MKRFLCALLLPLSLVGCTSSFSVEMQNPSVPGDGVQVEITLPDSTLLSDTVFVINGIAYPIVSTPLVASPQFTFGDVEADAWQELTLHMGNTAEEDVVLRAVTDSGEIRTYTAPQEDFQPLTNFMGTN